MAGTLRRGTIVAITLSTLAVVFAALDPALARRQGTSLLLPLAQFGLALLALISLVDAMRRRPRALWTALVCAMALCAVEFLPWDAWYHRLTPSAVTAP